MRIDEGGGITDQTKTKRIYDVTVRFFETVGAPVPLFTGDKSTEFPSDYGTDGFVVVKQDQPLPMTVLAIYARLELYDT